MLNSISTDQELWQGVQTSNLKAFNLLFERYWDSLYTTAYSYLNDQDICVNVVQDIFTNLWLKRKSLQIELLPQYLKTATRYHIYKEIKKIKSSITVYTQSADKIGNEDLNAGEKKLIHQDLESWLNIQLNALPQRCREIFSLSRKQGLSNDEIARRLNISKRTVENQITHALQHIRNNLKDLSFLLIIMYIS